MVVVALQRAFVQPIFAKMPSFVIIELLFLHRREAVCVEHNVMTRHRCDSCPSEKAMGSLWSKFEPIRTESGSGVAALSRRPSDDHVDGVAATWPRMDAIFMILK